jgi:hypothetical protein
MLTLTSKGVLESLAKAKEANPDLFNQPRGLSVPVPPPAELNSTPGVADSAEREAERAGLVAQVRRQRAEFPVSVADQALHGAFLGSLFGLGFQIFKLFGSTRQPSEYYVQHEDPGDYVDVGDSNSCDHSGNWEDPNDQGGHHDDE